MKPNRIKLINCNPTILAHTLAGENASGRVLRKCNFRKVGELEDEEDGLIWRWELVNK